MWDSRSNYMIDYLIIPKLCLNKLIKYLFLLSFTLCYRSIKICAFSHCKLAQWNLLASGMDFTKKLCGRWGWNTSAEILETILRLMKLEEKLNGHLICIISCLLSIFFLFRFFFCKKFSFPDLTVLKIFRNNIL